MNKFQFKPFYIILWYILLPNRQVMNYSFRFFTPFNNHQVLTTYNFECPQSIGYHQQIVQLQLKTYEFRTFSCSNRNSLILEQMILIELNFKFSKVMFSNYDSFVLLHCDLRLVDNCFQFMTNVVFLIAFLALGLKAPYYFIFLCLLITSTLILSNVFTYYMHYPTVVWNVKCLIVCYWLKSVGLLRFRIAFPPSLRNQSHVSTLQFLTLVFQLQDRLLLVHQTVHTGNYNYPFILKINK